MVDDVHVEDDDVHVAEVLCVHAVVVPYVHDVVVDDDVHVVVVVEVDDDVHVYAYHHELV